MILTTKLDRDRCPHCGMILDAATGTKHDTRPEAGDYTVCVECVRVAIYGENLRLRQLTEAEKREAESMPELQNVVRLLLGHKRHRLN